MAIVTQAFGLSTKFVDTIADSYLFNVHAANVLNFVDKLHAAYREAAKSDSTDPVKKLKSMPEVFTSIKGYLKLCLPPIIEAKMAETVSTTTVKGSSGPSGAVITLKSVPPS